MKAGFLTGCLDLPLTEIVEFASTVGFQALELSAWPVVSSRDYSGSTIDIERMDQKKAEEISRLLQKHSITISSLAYYDNNLHHDLEVREGYLRHLHKVIDVAHLLDVELVGTFVGRDQTKTIAANMDEFEKVFTPLLSYAESKNVKIMIENCPMPGWNLDGCGGTISYSPELWREMFKRVVSKNFGLNLDPSHLYWLGIDYLRVISDFKDRIFHVHAKDVVVFKDKVYEYGIFGKQLNRKSEWDVDWWTYRMPGRGEIDWAKFIATLKENGYDGVISIEHEDSEYEGTVEKAKAGLKLGYQFLAKYL